MSGTEERGGGGRVVGGEIEGREGRGERDGGGGGEGEVRWVVIGPRLFANLRGGWEGGAVTVTYVTYIHTQCHTHSCYFPSIM